MSNEKLKIKRVLNKAYEVLGIFRDGSRGGSPPNGCCLAALRPRLDEAIVMKTACARLPCEKKHSIKKNQAKGVTEKANWGVRQVQQARSKHGDAREKKTDHKRAFERIRALRYWGAKALLSRRLTAKSLLSVAFTPIDAKKWGTISLGESGEVIFEELNRAWAVHAVAPHQLTNNLFLVVEHTLLALDFGDAANRVAVAIDECQRLAVGDARACLSKPGAGVWRRATPTTFFFSKIH